MDQSPRWQADVRSAGEKNSVPFMEPVFIRWSLNVLGQSWPLVLSVERFRSHTSVLRQAVLTSVSVVFVSPSRNVPGQYLTWCNDLSLLNRKVQEFCCGFV
jgi:hypothetical protein